MTQTAEQQQREQEHHFGAARMVAALTALSRVFGMARDVVLVPLAQGAVADAFWMAFRIPHLFRRLFGEGALTAAFVPVFTEADEKAGSDRARAVLGNTTALLTAVLAALLLLIELGMLAALLAWPMSWERQYTLKLVMIMLPFALAICVLALLSAALNSKGHFFYPALAPVLLNLGIIAGAYVGPLISGGADDQRFAIESVAIVLAAFLHVLPAIWLVARWKMMGRLQLLPVLAEVKSIARKMGPTFIPLSMSQFADLAVTVVAMALTATAANPDLPLGSGVVKCQYAAGRLYQFPMGVLGVSLSTVVFPLLSRYAARGDRDGLRDTLSRALRLCFFLGVPTGAALVVLARPIVGVIFGHHKFTIGDDAGSDLSRTAVMLQLYSIGMPAYFVVHILLRAFFAQKETRGPLIVSSILGVLNVALVVVGIFTPLRSGSLGLATTITFVINAVLFGWMIQHRVGRLDWRAIGLSAARVCAATAVMGAAAWAGWHWLEGAALHRALKLVAAMAAGMAAFLAAAAVFRCGELGELLRRKKAPAAID